MVPKYLVFEDKRKNDNDDVSESSNTRHKNSKRKRSKNTHIFNKILLYGLSDYTEEVIIASGEND